MCQFWDRILSTEQSIPVNSHHGPQCTTYITWHKNTSNAFMARMSFVHHCIHEYIHFIKSCVWHFCDDISCPVHKCTQAEKLFTIQSVSFQLLSTVFSSYSWLSQDPKQYLEDRKIHRRMDNCCSILQVERPRCQSTTGRSIKVLTPKI